MAAQGNMDSGLFKSKLNERRDTRLRYRAPLCLLWDEQSCQPKYAKASCSEVSEHGLSLETRQPIPVGAKVALRSESGTLFGGARVKHVAHRGSTYVLGVEFNHGLLDQARTLVREVYSAPRAK